MIVKFNKFQRENSAEGRSAYRNDQNHSIHKDRNPLEEGPAIQANGSIVDKLNQLNMLVKHNDPSFIIRFHEYFPYFAIRLNEMVLSSLNSAELEICAYTKLNFSTKDIALYRRLSIRSVENRKYRIRKKLGLRSEDDFMLWIAQVKLT